MFDVRRSKRPSTDILAVIPQRSSSHTSSAGRGIHYRHAADADGGRDVRIWIVPQLNPTNHPSDPVEDGPFGGVANTLALERWYVATAGRLPARDARRRSAVRLKA